MIYKLQTFNFKVSRKLKIYDDLSLTFFIKVIKKKLVLKRLKNLILILKDV